MAELAGLLENANDFSKPPKDAVDQGWEKVK